MSDVESIGGDKCRYDVVEEICEREGGENGPKEDARRRQWQKT